MGSVVERIAPSSISASTNLSGAVSAVQDDPDSPDGSWITAVSTTVLAEIKVAMGDPSRVLRAGVGLQEIRTLVRRNGGAGGTPSYQVSLWNAGVALFVFPVVTIAANTTGEVVQSFLWDASDGGGGVLSGTAVEVRIAQQSLGGTGGNRASLDVGAIEWNAVEEGFSGWGVPL